MMLVETWPLATKSEANARGHWGKKAGRTSGQRGPAKLLFEPRVRGLGMALPMVVKLTRVSPRELDDDNLISALKAVRDGIADALKAIGVKNDRTKGLTWEYAQERGKPHEQAVRVEVTW